MKTWRNSNPLVEGNLCQQLCRDCERRSEPVPLRHGGYGKGPRDGELGIIECDRYVLGRVVSAVNAIGHVRRVGKGLKSVRAASRHVKRDLVVITELEAFPVPVRRRGRPKIHDDVKDRAV